MRSIESAALDYTPLQANDPDLLQTIHIQSESAEDMQQRVSEALSGSELANLAFCDIAGAGDGHTFVCRIQLCADTTGGGISRENVRMFFYLASDAENLVLARRAKQAEIAATIGQLGAGVFLRQTGLAGASQGTRFMGMLLVDTTQPN